MGVGRLLTASAWSATSVAAVTGLVYALRPITPTLSLGVLYTLAVLASAVLWGLGVATGTAVASMVAFNFLFLPPVHTLSLRNNGDWAALGVYLVVAIVASELATRARRRAAEAEQREREAELLADAAAALLEGRPLDESLVRSEQVLSAGDAIARPRFEAALAALVDVAEERDRHDTLRRSDAIKTAVLQSVSHDFRTPLATIAAAVEGLQSRDLALTADDRAALLETMASEVARLIRLVENLLDLSRLQVGAAAPHPALWPVEELVPRAVLEVRDRARVQMSFPDGLPLARVDDVQIQRVLANLIDNALKFSHDTVEVSASAEGDALVVDVHDRGGAGAPGAGIGLSIARGFAEINGGSVELRPRPTGGMTARLVLPAERQPAGTVS
jgi:two-component system, OmpR family, sensor histidine kinase KdpD